MWVGLACPCHLESCGPPAGLQSSRVAVHSTLHAPRYARYAQQSTCNASCKRYASELKQTECTVLSGGARTKCEYRVKAFQYGCQSVCAQ